MRILITGGAPRRDERGSEWGGHVWHTAWRYRGLAERRPGEVVARIDVNQLDAFVREAGAYDGVLCETNEALLLVREWEQRGLSPRFVLALEVESLGSMEAVRRWYRESQGCDPWPLLRDAPYVAWIAPTSRQARFLLQAGIAPERVHHVPFGAASFALLLPEAERLLGEAAEAGTSRPGFAGSVLFAGNGERDWATILQTVRALPDLPCAIVGGSRSSMERYLQARQQSWPPNVQQIDFVPIEEFIQLLRVARVVVVPLLPGDHDAGHSTIALAHRLGVPVVCSDLKTVEEYCEPERTAVMVEPEDPAALAAVTLRVWGDDALRERLTTQGRTVDRLRDERFRQGMLTAIAGAAHGLPRDRSRS